MLKSFISLLPLVFGLSACVTQPVIDPNKVSDLQVVSDRIDSLNADLSAKFLLSCAQKIDQLGKKIEPKVITKVVERCTSEDERAKRSFKKFEGRLHLGAVENVRLVKEKVSYAARIDTGADYSSIGVYDVKVFERDGENWVRFSLDDSMNAARFEYPIFDTVRIKESSTLTVDRIEIKMDIKMGGTKYKNQIFNLADRSYLEYQLLIGRSFLRDIAVVDVSRKNIQRSN
ncbi:MAG: hypothetical protein ACI9FR_001696 [Cryomorphaceae bacterium]|jgi:hypothetical protein